MLDLEYRIMRTNGEMRWLSVRGRTTFRGSGSIARPFQASGIVQDVTERRLAEENIREREEMYRSVIEYSLQGIAIIQDGRIVLCNEALCRMNGYSKEEAYQMTQEEVLETVHPEDRPRVIEAMQTLAKPGGVWPVEVIRLLDKEGRVRWIEMLGARSRYRGTARLAALVLGRHR